jgi:hypothetical protein
MYEWTCRMCGETHEGETVRGLVISAQIHYINFHGLLHETDVETSGIEWDVKAIKEDIEEK